ncbi:energy transducer TonB [Aquimarina aquimarini]|uniref:energy transducer TonB n=1 Tax=Aquimarina aquimarini TaxID=1191734 RepID=UPI000D54E706|nr:energy transducer TonB [Aquimarina aquimarini]
MSNKHDANVRKSALVNFQIGLIASLLFTYVMFEVYTATPIVVSNEQNLIIDEPIADWSGVYKVYEAPKSAEVVERRSKPVADPEKFTVIDDHKKISEVRKEFVNDPVSSDPIDPSSIVDVEPDGIDEPEVLPFVAVEYVPVFPGCEELKTNSERASCFSDKIKRMVSKKFNTDLGEDLGLKGLQRIYVQFEVYKDGTIKNIMARAPHPSLEKEAKRVVAKFPKMTPGMQRDRAVTVRYQLPIVFKVQN